MIEKYKAIRERERERCPARKKKIHEREFPLFISFCEQISPYISLHM